MLKPVGRTGAGLRGLVVATVFLLLLLKMTGAVEAFEIKSPRVGFWVCHGISTDTSSSDYRFVGLNPYWGFFLTEPGPGYKLSLEFALEGSYYRHTTDRSGDYEMGLAPILRIHYGFEETISPFLELSTAGLVYTDMKVPETGSDINFSSHVGLGFNWRLSESYRLSLAYRFRHMSNAGLAHENGGINYHQALVGLSFPF